MPIYCYILVLKVICELYGVFVLEANFYFLLL